MLADRPDFDGALCAGRGEKWMLKSDVRGRKSKTRALTKAALICNQCPAYEQCCDWVISCTPDPCPFHVVAAMFPVERGHVRHLMRLEIR